MAGLTTHILDLTHGVPAAGVTVELYSYQDGHEKQHKKTSVTNSDGRLDEPLLSPEETKIGDYEIIFYIGEYFRKKDTALQEPLFLDVVPVRFGISDAGSHYHVPLLVSPWGYQVYRGS